MTWVVETMQLSALSNVEGQTNGDTLMRLIRESKSLALVVNRELSEFIIIGANDAKSIEQAARIAELFNGEANNDQTDKPAQAQTPDTTENHNG